MIYIYGTMSSVGGTMSSIYGTINIVGGTVSSSYGTMHIVGGTISIISGTMSIVGGAMSTMSGTMSNPWKSWVKNYPLRMFVTILQIMLHVVASLSTGIQRSHISLLVKLDVIGGTMSVVGGTMSVETC